MDILEIIRNDENLRKMMHKKTMCNFVLFDEFYPIYSEDFTIGGKVFGRSCCYDNNRMYFFKYILLDDGSVGILLFSEIGLIGRVAENLYEFFTLLLNAPYYMGSNIEELYYAENIELLKEVVEFLEKYRKEDFNKYSQKHNWGYDYDTAKLEISKKLNIPIDNDVASNTMQKFYYSVTREPKFSRTDIYPEEEYYCKILKPYSARKYNSLEEYVNEIMNEFPVTKD